MFEKYIEKNKGKLVLLAPLSGITDPPFRSLVRSFGTELVISEMMACRELMKQGEDNLKKASLTPGGMTSIQITGNEIDSMADAAKLIENMGADAIDINFGCPVRKVINGYAGSALMKDTIHATKILKSVVNSVKIPVTLKMRMGWNNEDLNAPIIAKIAEDIGIKMLVVHGRTRCQMFKGKANWEFIKKVKDVVNIPVIVNGDINNLNDVSESLLKSNADGVMIGRGAYGKPWLINQIESSLNDKVIMHPIPTKEEKLKIVLNHLNSSISHYGIIKGIAMMRKHINWYSTDMNNASQFRSTINRITCPELLQKAISDFWQMNKN
ncbi:MAG: tRNA dihydrouridine synthase DusB [Anaplasmataceae bacterium]|nr:tRNA dihydrouridine synthase DusB [Anaplasmataceae bacterium]